LNRINWFIFLTQIVGAVFVILTFGVIIATSELGAPGGSILNVLNSQPFLRIPFSVMGGLFLALVLGSLGLYAAKKTRDSI